MLRSVAMVLGRRRTVLIYIITCIFRDIYENKDAVFKSFSSDLLL